LAFIALIFLRGGDTEEAMARTTIGDGGGISARLEAPTFEAHTPPDAPPQPMLLAAEEIVAADLSGRVYDSDSDEGLPAIVIHLNASDSASETLESVNIETDPKGYYSFTNLALGAYTVAIDPIDDYPAALNSPTSREIVLLQAGAQYQTDFPLSKGGTLVGLVTAGTTPVSNSSFSITNYFDHDHLSLPEIRTDEEGHYRVTGLADFTGVLRASRTRDDGVRQGSTQSKNAVTVIAAGTTATADFTFPGGGASIEGHVYFIDESQPIRASLYTYYNYISESGDEIAGIATYVSTDENGYYRIDDMAAGVLSLQVHTSGIVSGTTTDVAILEEGKLTVHDIIFGDSKLLCRFFNIPEGSKSVMVSVESGTKKPIEHLTRLDFTNSLGDTVSWGHVNFRAQEPTKTLTNLKPGDYTVVASSLPTRWNVAEFLEMGWDTFLSRIISTRVYFTIESFSETIEVDLDFDLVEAWHTGKAEEAPQ